MNSCLFCSGKYARGLRPSALGLPRMFNCRLFSRRIYLESATFARIHGVPHTKREAQARMPDRLPRLRFALGMAAKVALPNYACGIS